MATHASVLHLENSMDRKSWRFSHRVSVGPQPVTKHTGLGKGKGKTSQAWKAASWCKCLALGLNMCRPYKGKGLPGLSK